VNQASAQLANLDRSGQTPWNKGTKGAQEAWNRGQISLVEEHRECQQCDGWLPFSAFPRAASKPGGVASTCRACANANRAAAEAKLWGQVVALLGGRCPGCKIGVRSVLHLRPLTPWAERQRGAGKEKRSATVGRMLLAAGEAEARKHFALQCANCEIRAKHGRERCPR
jgi:hypothetical protein